MKPSISLPLSRAWPTLVQPRSHAVGDICEDLYLRFEIWENSLLGRKNQQAIGPEGKRACCVGEAEKKEAGGAVADGGGIKSSGNGVRRQQGKVYGGREGIT